MHGAHEKLPPPTMRGWRPNWRVSAPSTPVAVADGRGILQGCWFLLRLQSPAPCRPPLRRQGPDAAPLTTTIGIEDDTELLADVKVTPTAGASLTMILTITAIEEAGAELLADAVKVSPHVDAAPKVKTTGEPSVDLFEVAAQEFVEALRPEARPVTPRVFMEEDLGKIGAPFTVRAPAPAAAPHAVTKIAPSAATAVETVTKVEPEIEVVKAKPFTPTPEEDGPTTPRGKNRRRSRGSDDDQDEAAAKRRDRGAHPAVVVHENVVRRAVNLETGEEEIEVLDAGELAIERFSKRPARNRSYQSGNTTITTDARGLVSTQRRKRRKKLHLYLRNGR